MEPVAPPPANDQLPPPPPAATTSGSPTDFLKGVVGERAIVCLISGVNYGGACSHLLIFIFFKILHTYLSNRLSCFIGVLSCLDGYMNIVLEQTEEHVNGAVTNQYGDAFIRGNNGAFDCFISAQAPFLQRCICSYVHVRLCLEYNPSSLCVSRRLWPEADALFQYYTSRQPKPYNVYLAAFWMCCLLCYSWTGPPDAVPDWRRGIVMCMYYTKQWIVVVEQFWRHDYLANMRGQNWIILWNCGQFYARHYWCKDVSNIWWKHGILAT